MTGSIIEARRVRFEAWVKTFNSMPAALFMGEKGRYIDDWIQCRWLGFNAALDFVVVELPANVDHFADDEPGRRAFSLHTNHAIDQCRQAIEKAGVRTK